MSSGRTSWWGKDSGWYRRDYIIALIEEFGAAGPCVIDYLCCECSAQDGYRAGTVKANNRAIVRDTGVALVTLLDILVAAQGHGLLEDFERLDDSRFTCRISGWKADRDRALASIRKARSRISHENDETNVTGHDLAVLDPQSKAKQSKEYDADVIELCELLASRMRINLATAKVAPESSKWREDMRLLVEKDGHAASEVRSVIDWCQSDEFWKINCRSPGNLRKQYDRFALAMGLGSKQDSSGKVPDSYLYPRGNES